MSSAMMMPLVQEENSTVQDESVASLYPTLDPHITQIADARISPVKQVLNVVMKQLYSSTNAMVELINIVPRRIYTGSMELTNSIAGKLQEYGDAVSGKNHPASKSFVSMIKTHYDYAENIRKNNPQEYKKLVKFSVMFNTSPPAAQPMLLQTYFAPTGQEAQQCPAP